MFKELLKEVFPLIEKAAPTIANALGAPVVGIPAMWALSLIGNKFGLDSQHIDPSKLISTIQNDPECHDKLCELESNFADWFHDNHSKIKAPSFAEVNIKLQWSNQPPLN